MRPMTSLRLILIVSCWLLVCSLAGAVEPDALTTFEQRRDYAVSLLGEVPFEVKTGDSRQIGDSIPNASLVAFLLGRDLAAANEAMGLYADYFITNRAARNDQHSLYWSAELVVRIIEFCGSGGSVAPGRLDPAVEGKLYELMWLFAEETSFVDSYDEIAEFYATTDTESRQAAGDPMPVSANILNTQTWDVIESENHHAMTWMTLWDFTRLLAGHPAYKDRPFRDGRTAPEHYAAWSLYAQEYLRQRAKKALFVEMADGTYNSFTLKGVYNLYDFADDPVLRDLAGQLLTLYYASWAQEQLGGVRGGGKSRMNYSKELRSTTGISRGMWYYTGVGEYTRPFGGRLTLLTSNYRLPDIVTALATQPEARGEYEIRDRPLGLASEGKWTNPHYKLLTDYGGIIRYAYCTPDFIMGLPMVPFRKMTNWTKISSQGRWQGVIFAGDRDARIVVTSAGDKGSNNNQHYGIQSKGTMITQRLEDGYLSRGTVNTRCWLSDNGMKSFVERGGWMFVEAPSAYAATRPARGGYELVVETDKPRDGSNWSGRWMIFEDGFSPAILEVARESQYDSFEAFQEAVLACPIKWEGERLSYTGLGGDQFVFHADYSRNPTVNGQTPNYFEPDYAFESPYVYSKWDSGVVTIQFQGQRLVLDFNDGREVVEAQLADARQEQAEREAARLAEQQRREAMRPKVEGAWISPNNAYLSISDPANWTSNAVPSKSGDMGHVAGEGPIRIAMDHQQPWLGTLLVEGANLDFSNGGIGNGNGIAQLALKDSAIICISNQKGDRPALDAQSRIHVTGKNSLVLENSAHDSGWNFWGNVEGPGSLVVTSRRRGKTTTVPSTMRGQLYGIDLVLQGARLSLHGSFTFKYKQETGQFNTISRTGDAGAENRLLLYGDLQVDPRDYSGEPGRSWTLIDWTTFSAASGWPGGESVVRTGDTAWTATGGKAYYNGEGGRTWTLEAGDRTWVFTEATGVLEVK